MISVHELVGNCTKNLTILLSFCFRLPILRSTLVILQRRKKEKRSKEWFPKRNAKKGYGLCRCGKIGQDLTEW